MGSHPYGLQLPAQKEYYAQAGLLSGVLAFLQQTNKYKQILSIKPGPVCVPHTVQCNKVAKTSELAQQAKSNSFPKRPSSTMIFANEVHTLSAVSVAKPLLVQANDA